MDRFAAVLKRDFIYILLLALIVGVFVSYHISDNSSDSDDTGQVVAEQQLDQQSLLEEKMRSGHINKSLSVFLLVMFAGAFLGILFLVIVLIKGFPKRKYYARSANSEDDVGGKAVLDHEPAAPWTLWDVAKILIIFFTAYLAFSTLQGIATAVKKIPHEDINVQFAMILNMLFAEIVALFFLFRLIRINYDTSLDVFGLYPRNFMYHVMVGCMSYCMFLPFFFAVNYSTYKIAEVLGIELEPQQIFYLIADESNFTGHQYRVLILFIAFIGPVCEEIFFRGFLYRSLKKYIGVFGGLLISAVLFSLIHNNMMAFFPILGLGIMLGILVEKTGSLLPSIVMHIIVNSVSLALFFALTKQ
ncbi:MAG: CPBP family intramembrane glutamic endopeptidase [Candidatus Auribacterota bacterium]